MAHYYFYGKGVQKNHYESFKLLRKVAIDPETHPVALAEALSLMGMYYEKGHGVAQDISKAEECFKIVSSQTGNKGAQLRAKAFFARHATKKATANELLDVSARFCDDTISFND